MAESNVKKIRIPIEAGIVTFGTGYEIGPRLRWCANLVWRWQGSDGVTIPYFGNPDVPDESNLVVLPGAEQIKGIGYISCADGTFFLGAGNVSGGSKQVYVWDLVTGNVLPITGTPFNAGSIGVEPFSFAFATNISEPTTFLVRNGQPKKKIIAGGSEPQIVDYTPTPFNPDSPIPFCTTPKVCYYHLNRLWLAYTSDVLRRTMVFFSDPLTTDTIRGTNFLDIPDQCMTIFRASASDVDMGAQSHLIFGCRGSFYILDGDPTIGNAVFRELKTSFGVFSAFHAVETSEGAVVLATDNRFYLFPRGGQEPIAIDEGVQGRFQHIYTDTRLGWRAPYLYVLDRPTSTIYTADMRDLNKGITWSGPHTASAGMHGMISDVPYSTSAFIPIFSAVATAYLHPSSATPLLRTGFIFEPDCDVMFERAVFDVKQISTQAASFKFRVFNQDHLFDEFVVNLPANPNYPGLPAGADYIVKVVVTAQPQNKFFGDFFYLELEGSAVGSMRNCYVNYRVEPRKD